MFFGPPPVKTTLLVDITSSSVGAGYLSEKKGDAPVLVHAVRESIQGDSAPDMLRALDAALARIHKEAGPKRHTLIGGNGIEDAMVCVGAPWQESVVQTKTVEKEKPFTYTKEMLRDALHEQGGRNLLIASLMNGYAVQNPVGKRVKRADTIVLRSRIVPELYDIIRRAIRGAAGGSHAKVVAFAEVAHGVLTAAFPQDHDYIALRITRDSTEAAFVRRGMLSATGSVACGSGTFHTAARSAGVTATSLLRDNVIDLERSAKLSGRITAAQQAWAGKLRDCLSSLAGGGALPRAVFLFTEDGEAAFLSRLFDDPNLQALWLSDEPLTPIEVRGTLFDPYLHRTQEEGDDAFLDALALLARS